MDFTDFTFIMRATAETPPEAPVSSPCVFCETLTANAPEAKTGWVVCFRPTCGEAALAQRDRIYAGLVDCPETRAAALRWVKARAHA